MTTAERLRRRQLIESGLIIVIGVLMLLQTAYFQGRAAEQQDCLAENFQELSVALNARGVLQERETAQNQALWGIYAEAAGLVKDDPTAELEPADQERLQRKLVAQLLEYDRVMENIERERKDNPFPPYPAGQCKSD
jgi:hypothetical protein